MKLGMRTILVLIAIILFVIAGFGFPLGGLNLVAFGLAAWATSTLLGATPSG